MHAVETTACAEPRCVASLLDRLADAAESLGAGRPLGPYVLEALLADVELCPAMAHREGMAGDRHAELEDAVAEARNAAAVLRICPDCDRSWVRSRLTHAIGEAHRQLALRVADAGQRADPGSLVNHRCASCSFA